MKYILFIYLVITGCTKQQPFIPEYKYTWDKYQCIIDDYHADTTSIISRHLWAQYYASVRYQSTPSGWQEIERKGYGADTLQDTWFLDCNTMLINHIYYLKNSVKIFKTKYPNSIPEKIDTNFINYNYLPSIEIILKTNK